MGIRSECFVERRPPRPKNSVDYKKTGGGGNVLLGGTTPRGRKPAPRPCGAGFAQPPRFSSKEKIIKRGTNTERS